MGEEKVTIEEVYYEFRRAQAESKNRGFRIPKNLESHLKNKMSKTNREALEEVTGYFNTKWMNVDVGRYMDCGFELLKSFTYTKFFDPRVINLYIQKDKNIKRMSKLSKKALKDSMVFVKKYMKENEIPTFSRYCMLKTGNISRPIEHYLNNFVDKYFITLIVKNGYLKLDDENRNLVPYIKDNYRDLLVELDQIKTFTDKLKREMEK